MKNKSDKDYTIKRNAFLDKYVEEIANYASERLIAKQIDEELEFEGDISINLKLCADSEIVQISYKLNYLGT